MSAVPETPGQLFDRLEEWFGFGGWDERTSNQPYYLTRIRQVNLLKKLMRERNASIAQVYIAGRYCREQRIPVRALPGLFVYMADALTAHVIERQAAAAQEMAHEIEAAVAWEQQHHPGDETWLGQLLRVQGDVNKREALTQWMQARSH